jgi:histone deacetylase complex subunit SAP18
VKLSFSLVYPDTNTGKYNFRHVGKTFSSRRSDDDLLTLQACRFGVGDYVDVAIF